MKKINLTYNSVSEVYLIHSVFFHDISLKDWLGWTDLVENHLELRRVRTAHKVKHY